MRLSRFVLCFVTCAEQGADGLAVTRGADCNKRDQETSGSSPQGHAERKRPNDTGSNSSNPPSLSEVTFSRICFLAQAMVGWYCYVPFQHRTVLADWPSAAALTGEKFDSEHYLLVKINKISKILWQENLKTGVAQELIRDAQLPQKRHILLISN